MDNVTVITRTPGQPSRLPLECCEAILLRAVYHEFRDRSAIAATMARNLRPGGLLADIDFDEGTPDQMSGHGIARATTVREVTAAGFEIEQVIEDWAGNAYCVLFRRPASGSS